jgi:hypothetical protein
MDMNNCTYECDNECMKKIKYCCSVLENVKSRHYLASALLNYLDSPDYLLACTAMRNLLILTGRYRGGGGSVADPEPTFLCDPWIREGKKSGSGSGTNYPYQIFESLETIFWVKIFKFFDADPVSGMENIRIRYPGCKKFGSGINITEPQHWEEEEEEEDPDELALPGKRAALFNNENNPMRIHFDLKRWIRNCTLRLAMRNLFLYILFVLLKSPNSFHCIKCTNCGVIFPSPLPPFFLLIAGLDSETSAHALVTGSPFLALVTARLACLAQVPFLLKEKMKYCPLSLIQHLNFFKLRDG